MKRFTFKLRFAWALLGAVFVFNPCLLAAKKPHAVFVVGTTHYSPQLTMPELATGPTSCASYRGASAPGWNASNTRAYAVPTWSLRALAQHSKYLVVLLVLKQPMGVKLVCQNT